MSNRLLIAVLTLGLLITFCGMAFASDAPKSNPDRVVSVNQNAPRFNDLQQVQRHEASFQKPIDGIGQLQAQTTVLPPPYFCDFIDYSGGAAAYFWNIPDAYGDDLMNMRFTSAVGYDCSLLTAYIGVYAAELVGTPDMVVSVWDDDGFGFPGTQLGSVIVPFSALPTTGLTYVPADLSTANGGSPFVFSDGAEYHVAVTTSDHVNNVISILSDDGSNGTLRSSENWNGYWGLMLDDWGVDVNFLIGVDICCADIPYTECYTQDYACNVAYFWTQPDAYGDDYFNMRFTSEGPETLTGVDIAFYGSETVGVPDADIFVWGGDGSGFPDLSVVHYSTTVANADIDYFGATEHVDLTAENLVVIGDFFVGWSTNDATGGVLAGLSDDGSCGTMRSSEYWGLWGSMLDDWGVDVNFIITADLCKDEFNLCQTEYDYCGLAYFWRLPDRYGDVGDYQKISATGVGCRLEEIRIALYDTGDAGTYTTNSEVQIYASDGGSGLPGTLLGAVTITPAEYVMYPAMQTVDVSGMNILYDDDLWVGIESLTSDTLLGIRTLSDDGSCGDLQSCENWAGSFFYMLDDWGTDYNFVMEADMCCIPPDERTCTPGENWPTTGHDYRRTAASQNSTGDARCQQAVSWVNEDADGFVYARPMISDGIVVAMYHSKLQAFDIANGALLWQRNGLPELGSSLRNSVTIDNGVIFAGGGNARSFSAFDLVTGATIWSHNVLNNPGYEAYAGNLIYTTSVVLNGVVYFGTTAGEFVALDAVTGLAYAGWTGANPMMLDGDVQVTTSSNGSSVIYVGTDGAFGNGNGTLYAIDAATGAINWSLTNDGTGSGLLGYDVDGDTTYTVTTEIFQGPISVDADGSLYFITSFNDEIAGAPSGGYYRVDANGSVVWAKGGKFQRFTGPVQDVSHVIFQSLRAWTSETIQMDALKKSSGGNLWTSDPSQEGMAWVEGALSCEPLLPDLYYTGNGTGEFLAVNSDDGSIAFSYEYVQSISGRFSGAAIDPSHVVMSNRQGDLYCFTNQADRPRLAINTYDTLIPIPFFTPDGTEVTYPTVFFNNGCADLTYSLTADDSPVSVTGTSVDPNRLARLQAAANSMTDNSYPELASTLVKAQRVDANTFDADYTESAYSKDSYSNMAAYAPPAWLNFMVTTTGTLLEGEALDVVYNINGNLVFRGAQRCYVTIETNDAFYINSATEFPVVQLGVLGGCLQSEDVLIFGAAEENTAPVHNTGEFGNQNTSNFFSFDGDGAAYWQGGLFYMAAPTGGDDFTSPFRMAWTTDSWHGGDPPDFWNSLLPDPRCGACEPTLTPDPVLLGRMSHDGGQTYDDVFGYGAAYRYIDSVVNFACNGSWDWSEVNCAYDNALTLGIGVDETMYGVVGEAALANVVIYRMDIENRNHPAAIDDVYVGSFQDFDLESNGNDAWKFDQATSISWGSSCTGVDVSATKVYGMGKIPMDVDPMIGVRTVDANQGMWHNDNIALDSMYYWMTQQPGATAQVGLDLNWPCDPNSSSADRNGWFSFNMLNFDTNGLYSMGVYIFGFGGADVNDDARYTDLAILVNQFCGFSRGDINDDGAINLADIVALHNMLNAGGNGPLFEHLADVNNDGAVDMGDVLYLATYYFDCTCTAPAPVGAWVLPEICQ